MTLASQGRGSHLVRQMLTKREGAPSRSTADWHGVPQNGNLLSLDPFVIFDHSIIGSSREGGQDARFTIAFADNTEINFPLGKYNLGLEINSRRILPFQEASVEYYMHSWMDRRKVRRL